MRPGFWISWLLGTIGTALLVGIAAGSDGNIGLLPFVGVFFGGIAVTAFVMRQFLDD